MDQNMNLRKVDNDLHMDSNVRWKEFRIGDIFPCLKIKKYAKKPLSIGNVPFISCQVTNNGIAGYCDEKPEVSNCITVSTNGNCFDCFYHDYPIIPSSDVEVLYKDGVTTVREIALFLCAVLSPNTKLYSYTNKPKNGKVFDTVVSLPVTKEGDVPDWNYMAERIRKLEAERIRELEAYLLATGLDDYELTEADKQVLAKMSTGGGNFDSAGCNESTVELQWKEFRLGDLFDIVGTKPLDAGNMNFIENGINFVGRTNENNGVQGRIALQSFSPNEAFTITATVIGNYKYVKLQEEPYYCSQNINRLTIKDVYKEGFNSNVARYFIVHIQKFVEQYNGQQSGYKLDDIMNHKISLPAKEDGTPDYDFMERYIRAIEKVTIADVVKWKDKQIKTTKQVVNEIVA